LNANARKWIAALESGEYEQGMNFLMTTDNKYCCLGVACMIYNKSVLASDQLVIETILGEDEGEDKDYITVDGHAGVLPEPVRKWLKLITPSGAWAEPGCELTGMNDAGNTFTEIADLIKSEPEGLFEYD
jgi:hypothetical protein